MKTIREAEYSNRFKLLPLAVVAMAVGLGVPAYAQPAASEKRVIEEIIVSARRIEESLQEVPASVTAFTGVALERQGTQTIADLQRVVPNTTLQISRGTNSTLTAFIRGIGQQDPLWGFEPGVGLYLDDVYIARPQGAVLDVYDVERVEVLRGPQGTLYGKNTIGGAVKYVTKRMGGEAGGHVNINIGSYNQRDIIVSGHTSLTDTLHLGAAAAQLTREGFGEYTILNKDNYDKDVLTYRFTLEATPTEDLFIRLTGDRMEDNSNSRGGYRLFPAAFSGTPVRNDVYDTLGTLGGAVNEVKTEGLSLTAEYQLNRAVTLKSITAYREGETTTPIEFDGLPVNDLDVPAFYDDDQFTQEFQLIHTSDAFQLVSGLYYYEGNATGAFDVLLHQLLGTPFTALTAGTVDTESYAIYADATWNLTDRLSVSVGGRYTRDKKDAEVFRARYFGDGSPLFGNSSAILFSTDTDYRNDEDFEEFSPRISASYHLTDAVMLYGGFSTGFKSGGFDMRGDATINPETVNGYDPETVEAWELGIKGDFLDGRVRTNLAWFYSTYEDMQVTIQAAFDAIGNDGINDTFVSSVENVAESTIQGVELEMTTALTDQLSLMLNWGYIDAEFDKWLEPGAVAGQFVDVSGQRGFQNTPENSGHIRLTWDGEFANGSALQLSAGASYRDDVQIFEIPTALDFGDYWLYDANIVWLSPSEKINVGLHGRNLGDKEYRNAGYNFPTLGLENNVLGFYGDPRTVTLTLGYRF